MKNSEIKNDPDLEQYAPHEAVLLLQDWFWRRAGRMSRENVSLVEDLVQEMSVGVLRCRREHTLHFFKGRAVSRARDFLRKEKRQRIKIERYGHLRQRIFEDDDTPCIEGLVDLENKISSRATGDIVELYSNARASA